MSLHAVTSSVTPGPAYRALPRAPEAWVVENLCPTGGLFNIFGSPKSGKSFLALQLAIAISTNEPDWMTFPIRTHGAVMYLQLDTPRSLWAARLDDIAYETGLIDSEVYFGDNEQAPYPFNILGTPQDPVSPSWVWLREQVATVKPALVIIDTLRELHKGDENDSAQMTTVMSSLVSATYPSALCLLSHSRKDNNSVPIAQRSEDLMNDNRGSSYIAGRMDGIMRATSTKKVCHLTYQSRTVERHQLKCQRLPGGLWGVDTSNETALLHSVLADPTLTSVNAKAERLGQLLGRSTEACRSMLRRRIVQQTALAQAIALESLNEPEPNF